MDDWARGRLTGDLEPDVTQPQPVAQPVHMPEDRSSDADRTVVVDRSSSRTRGRRVGVGAGRTVLALLSVLALAGTGYAWTTLQKAQNGMVTADVLDKGATSAAGKPADGSMDILLVGMDSRNDAKGHPLPADQLAQLHAGPDSGELNTDTMILIHIPNGGGQAMGISIPRDSWVKIPGYGTNKINSAYGFAKGTALQKLKAQGTTDPAQLDVQSNEAGAREAIQTVEQLTGVGIDHYAAVNLMGFDQISNAIGGVPVCLNHAVNDSHWSGAVFPKGDFSVSGLQALEFVRQRHNIPGGSTDLEREQRQQAFLASMAHKVLSSGVLTSPGTLNSLIGAIQGAVTIDNHWNLIDFAQEMSGMTSGNIKFQTMPVVNIDYYPYGKGLNKPSAVEVDPQAVTAFVHGVTGIPATAPTNVAGTQTTPAPPSGSSNAAITVDVTNASGATKLASTVQSVLVGKGFGKGTTGDATHRATSVLYYPAGQETNAQAVAGALTGQFTLAEGSSVPAGHVWVYVGRNFNVADNPIPANGAPVAPAPGTAAGTAATTTAPTPPQGGTQPISDAGNGPPCVN
ncbi:MAG TPA: LCP family protein [Pseudonocardiaceae bacterium]|nr:LCP family protein [Pseudonocardiaceae bacterium]